MVTTLYLERAENELELAKIVFKITDKKNIQEDVFAIKQPLTFFSTVISHSYYCIFYAAKAYLINKGIKTEPPEEHRKTYDELRKLVDARIIDVELLKMYEQVMVKADTLLEIFRQEKGKRGKFTYQKIPQANKEPAETSLKHEQTFFKHIYNLLNN